MDEGGGGGEEESERRKKGGEGGSAYDGCMGGETCGCASEGECSYT